MDALNHTIVITLFSHYILDKKGHFQNGLGQCVQVPESLVEHCFSHKFKEGQLSFTQLDERDTSLAY